nr:uncharacterized protein LOC127346560 [Lolium perenne]
MAMPAMLPMDMLPLSPLISNPGHLAKRLHLTLLDLPSLALVEEEGAFHNQRVVDPPLPVADAIAAACRRRASPAAPPLPAPATIEVSTPAPPLPPSPRLPSVGSLAAARSPGGARARVDRRAAVAAGLPSRTPAGCSGKCARVDCRVTGATSLAVALLSRPPPPCLTSPCRQEPPRVRPPPLCTNGAPPQLAPPPPLLLAVAVRPLLLDVDNRSSRSPPRGRVSLLERFSASLAVALARPQEPARVPPRSPPSSLPRHRRRRLGPCRSASPGASAMPRVLAPIAVDRQRLHVPCFAPTASSDLRRLKFASLEAGTPPSSATKLHF